MSAADILQAAGEAGLTITVGAKALEVRGPEAAKAKFLPLVAQQAKAIRKILMAGGLQALPRCQAAPGLLCPACGWIHGSLAERLACGECGDASPIVAVVFMGGDRLCGKCLRGEYLKPRAVAG